MNRKRKAEGQVVSQRQIAAGIYDLWIETDMAQDAAAGQFVGVYPHNQATLLPRPISICEVNQERTCIRLVYRIAGTGTAEFAAWETGTKVFLLGVLGNGFPVGEAMEKRVFLMGGGIGIPPMLELAREIRERDDMAEVHIFAGYRDSQIFLKEDLEQYGTIHIATEDGSVGTGGNVIDSARESGLQPELIMACGPMPMLRAVKAYAAEQSVRAFISLEERMACGVGACLGCVCTTRKTDSHSHVKNARICTDGPVFEAGEIEC